MIYVRTSRNISAVQQQGIRPAAKVQINHQLLSPMVAINGFVCMISLPIADLWLLQN